MRKYYGITITDRGTFILSVAYETLTGLKTIKKDEWNCRSSLKNYLLLHKPIRLSVPAFWVSKPLTDSTDSVFLTVPNGMTIIADKSAYDMASGLLRHNITGIHPQDALLATLPRSFHQKIEPSFISILYEDPALKIGIIIDNVLVAVFTAVIESAKEFEGFLGRIERSWSIENKSAPFPKQLFLLNTLPFECIASPDAIKIHCGSDDPDILKASGSALCEKYSSAPVFSLLNSTKPGIYRTLILVLASIVILSSLVVSAVFYVDLRFQQSKVASVKNEYRTILDGNTEIRQLIAKGDSLAQKVLFQNEQSSHPTTWARFLHFIGKSKPDSLYIEKLGTEPIADNNNLVRVAMAGWSSGETIVTEFSTILSKSPFLHDVSLSSIERMSEQNKFCSFKIVCTLSLSKK